MLHHCASPRQLLIRLQTAAPHNRAQVLQREALGCVCGDVAVRSPSEDSKSDADDNRLPRCSPVLRDSRMPNIAKVISGRHVNPNVLSKPSDRRFRCGHLVICLRCDARHHRNRRIFEDRCANRHCQLRSDWDLYRVSDDRSWCADSTSPRVKTLRKLYAWKIGARP